MSLMDWAEMTIDELPKDDVRQFIDRFGTRILDELERAENCMQINYDLGTSRQSPTEVFSVLLPECVASPEC